MLWFNPLFAVCFRKCTTKEQSSSLHIFIYSMIQFSSESTVAHKESVFFIFCILMCRMDCNKRPHKERVSSSSKLFSSSSDSFNSESDLLWESSFTNLITLQSPARSAERFVDYDWATNVITFPSFHTYTYINKFSDEIS